MTINDFFSNNLSKIFNYLTDLLLFLFQPRKYFSVLSLESKQDTIRRFLVYIIFFEIISTSILITIVNTKKTFSALDLIGNSILDLIFSLYFLPVFLLIGSLCKPKVPLKLTLSYILTYKFTISIIIVILFGMFILFENYIFAIIKGIAVYFYIFFILILFPFIFSYQFKIRIKLIFLSLISWVILTFVIGTILTIMPSDTTYLVSHSVFYDPIGKELDEMMKSLDKFHLINNVSFSEKYFGDPNNLGSHSLRTNSTEFNNNLDQYTIELKGKLNLLDSLKVNSIFNTTKNLLEIKINEVIYEISFLNSQSELYDAKSFVNQADFSKKVKIGVNKFIKSIEYRYNDINYFLVEILFQNKERDSPNL